MKRRVRYLYTLVFSYEGMIETDSIANWCMYPTKHQLIEWAHRTGVTPISSDNAVWRLLARLDTRTGEYTICK